MTRRLERRVAELEAAAARRTTGPEGLRRALVEALAARGILLPTEPVQLAPDVRRARLDHLKRCIELRLREFQTAAP